MGAWVLLGQKKTKRSVTSPLMYIYCFVLRVDTSKSGLMDVSLLAPIWDSMASSSATLHHPLWSLRRLQWWQEFPEWILEEAATFRLWISARKILNRRSAVGKWLSCVTEIHESRFWWLNQSVNPFFGHTFLSIQGLFCLLKMGQYCGGTWNWEHSGNTQCWVVDMQWYYASM